MTGERAAQLAGALRRVASAANLLSSAFVQLAAIACEAEASGDDDGRD